MAMLTIGADDFDVDGPVPADAWFKFRRYRLDRRGPRLGSELAWTVTLDDDGNATTELPADQAGNALVITSSYPGFTQVTVAGYPEDVGTLARLLTYEVDPATLRQSSSAAAAWSLIVARVEALVATGVAHVAAAAASAAAAARSALGAADSASSSGTSAFNAGQSAATALGHANDSAGSAASAAGSAAEAIGVANTSVVDAFLRTVDQQARLIFRRKNKEEFDVGDIRGPQGLPGSTVPYGGDLVTTDLNTVLAVGVYRQFSSGNATLARNYPYAGHGGILEVLPASAPGTTVIQRFTVTQGSVFARGIYQRRGAGTVWDPWRFVPSQRVDQTAGRAIYAWDDLNGREQLAYGDTGFRNIAPTNDPAPFSSGIISIRRVGQLVQLAIVDLILLPSIAGSLDLQNLIPGGFRPTVQSEGINTYPVPERRNRVIAIGGTTTVRVVGVDSFTGRVCVTLHWYTNDPWPTSLPGNASGTIPNL